MKYTNLEHRQVEELYNIIKHKHNKPKIRDIDLVINEIMNSLETDEKMKNIYNKKYITDGVLDKLFITNNHHSDDNRIILNNIDDKLNCKIDRIRLNKVQKERKSCSCIIL
jgi:hypothetical protein